MHTYPNKKCGFGNGISIIYHLLQLFFLMWRQAISSEWKGCSVIFSCVVEDKFAKQCIQKCNFYCIHLWLKLTYGMWWTANIYSGTTSKTGGCCYVGYRSQTHCQLNSRGILFAFYLILTSPVVFTLCTIRQIKWVFLMNAISWDLSWR